MNPARMGKAPRKAADTPAAEPVGETPTDAPADPAVTGAEGRAAKAAQDAPVEVKPGELDPVALDVLGEVPDRPKTAEKAPDVQHQDDGADVPDAQPDAQPQGKAAPRALLAVGGVALAAVALIVGTTRRSSAKPTPAAQAAPTPQSAPAAPAAPAQGLVIR